MNNLTQLRTNTVLPDGEKIDSLYTEGRNWQLYKTASGGSALFVTEDLYRKWMLSELLEDGFFMEMEGGWIFTAPAGEMMASVEYGPYPGSSQEAETFAKAWRFTEKKTSRSLADGLYVARFALVLPTYQDSDGVPKDRAIGRWLSRRMNISVRDTARMRKYASYLPEPVLQRILDLFDFSPMGPDEGDDVLLSMPSFIDKTGLSGGQAGTDGSGGEAAGRDGKAAGFSAGEAYAAGSARRERKSGPFTLPGREELERFFNDDILDIIDREEEYKKFGVGFPGATIFYGPSGSGKTFAVEKFADYLGWPVFRITSGIVGSKYVHETSRRVSAVFDSAIRNAPSVLIIDEMESFLSARDTSYGSGQIHLEEVDEFLRRIPEAAENHVLLFGMTNMMDSIDEAVTRKGRFDHQIKVGMPSETEVLAVLENSLGKLPTVGNLRLPEIAETLAGRPLSDTAYVVSEAGKLSVRNKKKGIDADSLREACSHIAPVKKKRRIGF